MLDTKINVEIYCDEDDAYALEQLMRDVLDRARCDVIFDKYINVIKENK